MLRIQLACELDRPFERAAAEQGGRRAAANGPGPVRRPARDPRLGRAVGRRADDGSPVSARGHRPGSARRRPPNCSPTRSARNPSEAQSLRRQRRRMIRAADTINAGARRRAAVPDGVIAGRVRGSCSPRRSTMPSGRHSGAEALEHSPPGRRLEPARDTRAPLAGAGRAGMVREPRAGSGRSHRIRTRIRRRHRRAGPPRAVDADGGRRRPRGRRLLGRGHAAPRIADPRRPASSA